MANRAQGRRQERSAPAGAAAPKRRSAPRRSFLPQTSAAGPVTPGLVTAPPAERQKTALELDELVLPPQTTAPQAPLSYSASVLSPPPGLGSLPASWSMPTAPQPGLGDEAMGELADQFLALLDEHHTIQVAKLLVMQGYIKEEDVPGVVGYPTPARQGAGLQPQPVVQESEPPARSSRGARMMPAVPQMTPAPMRETLQSSSPVRNLPDTSALAGRQEPTPGLPQAMQVSTTAQPVHLSTFVGLVSKLQEACTSPMDPMTKLQQLPTIAEHLMGLPGVEPSQWLPTFLQMMQELLAAGSQGAAGLQPPIFALSREDPRAQHQESVSVSAPSDLHVPESIDEESSNMLEPSYFNFEERPEDAGQSAMSKEAVTSFIIQNLPLDFNQRQVMDFIDSYGYRDLYDVLLWFPAKKSSRRQTSSAFINFRNPNLAMLFRGQFHNMKFKEGDAKLNICPAIVQGFTENFVKFWHLTQKDPHSGSICCPYFATDQVEKVTAEQWQRARELLDAAGQARGSSTEWSATTLVIRNLPDVLASQDQVIAWLDELGHGKGYDFLLFVPKKTNPVVCQVASGAYAFVNYRSTHLAQECFHALQHKAVDSGSAKVVLNVVISKLQGKQACAERFKELAKGGRLVPFVDDRTNEQLDIQMKREGSQRPISWAYQ